MSEMELPQDDFILLSMINMKLRDYYDSLDSLCDDMALDRGALVARLSKAGFEYSAEQNRFI